MKYITLRRRGHKLVEEVEALVVQRRGGQSRAPDMLDEFLGGDLSREEVGQLPAQLRPLCEIGGDDREIEVLLRDRLVRAKPKLQNYRPR